MMHTDVLIAAGFPHPSKSLYSAFYNEELAQAALEVNSYQKSSNLRYRPQTSKCKEFTKFVFESALRRSPDALLSAIEKGGLPSYPLWKRVLWIRFPDSIGSLMGNPIISTVICCVICFFQGFLLSTIASSFYNPAISLTCIIMDTTGLSFLINQAVLVFSRCLPDIAPYVNSPVFLLYGFSIGFMWDPLSEMWNRLPEVPEIPYVRVAKKIIHFVFKSFAFIFLFGGVFDYVSSYIPLLSLSSQRAYDSVRFFFKDFAAQSRSEMLNESKKDFLEYCRP